MVMVPVMQVMMMMIMMVLQMKMTLKTVMPMSAAIQMATPVMTAQTAAMIHPMMVRIMNLTASVMPVMTTTIMMAV